MSESIKEIFELIDVRIECLKLELIETHKIIAYDSPGVQQIIGAIEELEFSRNVIYKFVFEKPKEVGNE